MPIRRIETDEDVARCFDVLHELRPALSGVEELLTFAREMRSEGVEFVALEQDGEITTVATFRVRLMIVSGRTMYVDDLVTAARFRSQGHGKAMLGWLMQTARERGCTTFSLDSGTFRQEAHAFYFREGMRITSFHFASPL